MHELAITQGVVDAVVEHVCGARVLAVNLRVGRLSGVVPDAVRFCFDLVSAGTPLEGARLEIEEPVGVGRCRSCGAVLDLDDVIVLCSCGSCDVQVTAGQELMVASVEVV